jgi:photosystem II stability/assembly factor-like uncharacterized protein
VLNQNITDESLIDVFFVDESKGYVVGYYGTALRTTDGGITWSQMNLTFSSSLFDVSFSDASIGVIVGENGTIYRTSDGGDTWNLVTINTTKDLVAVENTGSSDWWITCEATYISGSGISTDLYHSSDNGATWSLRNSNTGWGISDYRFINQSKGWAFGRQSSGTILVTNDGGFNWQQLPWSGTIYIDDLGFWDENNGWRLRKDVTVSPARIYYETTYNGGVSWQYAAELKYINNVYYSGLFSYYYQASLYDQNHGVIVGPQGLIYYKDGLQWQEPAPRTYADLTDIYFYDDQHGWSCSTEGTVLKTTNSGDDWNIIYVGENVKLNSVRFITTLSGIVVGDGGKIFRTNDGGVTWNSMTSNSVVNLNSVCFVNSAKVLIAGENGTLLKSYDNGATWSFVQVGNDALNDISFYNENIGWIAGNGGAIYKTTDGGTSWVQTDNTTFRFSHKKICALSESDAIVSNSGDILNKALYITRNNGNTWLENVYSPNWEVTDIKNSSVDVFWTIGGNGLMYSDNLDYINMHNIPIDGYYNDSVFIKKSSIALASGKIWIASKYGYIVRGTY